MTDTLFALVTSYGAIVVFASAYLSCLAIPIPTSFMMLAAGAFVAAGDLIFWQVYSAAFFGAVAGDQTGFHLGRWGGSPVVERLSRRPSRRKLVDRAQLTINQHGGIGVFFSTWLFAPLGPWVNFIAGAAKLHWGRFTLWDILGEAIWVSVYIGLGYAFAANISTVAEIAGNVVGILAALALAAAMVFWLRHAIKHHKEQLAKGLSEGTSENI